MSISLPLLSPYRNLAQPFAITHRRRYENLARFSRQSAFKTNMSRVIDFHKRMVTKTTVDPLMGHEHLSRTAFLNCRLFHKCNGVDQQKPVAKGNSIASLPLSVSVVKLFQQQLACCLHLT